MSGLQLIFAVVISACLASAGSRHASRETEAIQDHLLSVVETISEMSSSGGQAIMDRYKSSPQHFRHRDYFWDVSLYREDRHNHTCIFEPSRGHRLRQYKVTTYGGLRPQPIREIAFGCPKRTTECCGLTCCSTMSGGSSRDEFEEDSHHESHEHSHEGSRPGSATRQQVLRLEKEMLEEKIEYLKEKRDLMRLEKEKLRMEINRLRGIDP